MPDFHGLALRAPTAEGHGDLLFASTGLGRLTRFALTVSRTPGGRAMTTLLPYRTPAGAVLLSATFDDDSSVTLAWAVGTGAWHPFAHVVLDDGPAVPADQQVSFDPLCNELPGLENYRWVQLLREPSYAAARQTRSRRAGWASANGSHLPWKDERKMER